MQSTEKQDRRTWHQATSISLHITREQSESIIWSLLPYVKTRHPITIDALSRRLEVFVANLDEFHRALSTIAACDLTPDEALTIYTPQQHGLVIPALLVGVSPDRAKRLAVNARYLYTHPSGRLDQTDVDTLRSFFFAEVKDAVSQIGLDVKTKWPRKLSDLIKAPCQRTESAATAMAFCFQ